MRHWLCLETTLYLPVDQGLNNPLNHIQFLKGDKNEKQACVEHKQDYPAGLMHLVILILIPGTRTILVDSFTDQDLRLPTIYFLVMHMGLAHDFIYGNN